MKPETLICNSSNVTYDKGYIALWLDTYDLPETFTCKNLILHKKDHFHVSLLCVKNILETIPDIEDTVLKYFCEFQKHHPVVFTGFTGEYRLAKRDEKMSAVALCEVSNLHKFAEYLSEKINIEIHHQPAHVTLYTLQPNAGIGLNSKEELHEKSEPLEVSAEIRNILI